MKISERIGYLLGIILILFGVLLIIGAVGNIYKPENAKPIMQYVLLIVLMGLPMVLGGFFLCRQMKRNSRKRIYEALERQILQLAAKKKGQLTVADVAMQINISTSEAKKILEDFHLNGVADISASEGGNVLYRFRMDLPGKE